MKISYKACRYCRRQPVVTLAPIKDFVFIQCSNSDCPSRQHFDGIIKAQIGEKVADEWNSRNGRQNIDWGVAGKRFVGLKRKGKVV